MSASKIEVEYCGTCGHKQQFDELAEKVKEKMPWAELSGKEGRRGSFEVTINETLVHSKLQTLAFPDYDDVVEAAKEAEQGKPVRTKLKQQVITNCSIS
ncbi:migration and invasion enhancer 1 [Neocloeon triangulifer]|uniref:migration and invasion enhancer 1 n=1 Tax=Neocloeon triangulifer TaxID=2078957 RepID=UPI00286F7449|nr:migration and invasion enhancer 1 [Neocloeon triangulifer]